MEVESLEPSNFLELSKEKASDIALFCSVARANGAALSLGEIIQLTSLEISEEQLEKAWVLEPRLNSNYGIRSGIVHERNEKLADNSELKNEHFERKQRADSNITYATKFCERISGDDSLVLSISGSTSYHSVSREDDLDFFCITRKGAMWLFLTKALIKARLFRLADRSAPWLCLSYVMDEDYANSEFRTPQDGLFARDAIAAFVVHGEEYYNSLLGKCGWIEEYFPKMYRMRIAEKNEEQAGRTTELPRMASPIERALNSILYLTAGTYIRLKSALLNRRFIRAGQKSRVFKLRIGRDHCIYESLNYLELRKMYSKLEAEKKKREHWRKTLS